MENKDNKYNKTLKFLGITVCVIIALAIIYYGIDFLLKDCLSSTARAVISNFIVFASIIVIVSESQVKPAKMIEDAQKAVVETVIASEEAKSESEIRLFEAENSIAHIDEEIGSLFERSEANANLVGAKIIEDAEKTANIVQANAEKAIENSQLILKNELLRRASLASVEVARAHIINELNNNQGLHDRLIDESVEAIEGVELA